MFFFTAVADVYRRTRKPKDIFWNRFVARPAAAVLLVPLQRAPVTPNQITFASMAVFGLGAALLLDGGVRPGRGPARAPAWVAGPAHRRGGDRDLVRARLRGRAARPPARH